MSQKRGNNGEKFKRKIFLVKIWARKKGFLKPKSGQNWQKIEKKRKKKKIANIGANFKKKIKKI